MVNADLLKAHATNYKISMNNAAEYHKQLFTLHPELADFYNADGCDPDMIPKNRRFVMLGQHELQLFLRMPATVNDEKQWRSSLAGFKENSEDNGFPLEHFNKTVDAFLAAMEIHAGGVTAEQKKEWQALFDKAYADMKKFGWY